MNLIVLLVITIGVFYGIYSAADEKKSKEKYPEELKGQIYSGFNIFCEPPKGKK